MSNTQLLIKLPPEEEEPPKTLHILYVRGHSEKIEKTCAHLRVKAVFKPQSTLKQLLVKVKQKMPEEKKKEVVYQVPCMDCRKVYIGETKRTLKTKKWTQASSEEGGWEEWDSCTCPHHQPQHRLGGSTGPGDSTKFLEEENDGSNPDPCWIPHHEPWLWTSPFTCMVPQH